MEKGLDTLYFKLKKEYRELVEIEKLELLDKNILSIIMESLEKDKFRIEMIMMPSWAYKGKIYKICGDCFTHIRIKRKAK